MLFSKVNLKECPEGYYCPSGTITLNYTNLFEKSNMQACPNGFYCPKGTAAYFSITGNSTTP
jgi:uncharacterized protein (DUF427 family)